MSADTLARIFEPFFTTKFTGRGLGLAATLGILKSHGAGLVLESTPGVGTTFHLYFQPDGAPSRPASSAPRTGTSPLRVLVVDDENAVLQATTNMLAMLGHEVSPFGSAIDALAALEAASPPFDLVVLDLTMPKMDGAEALARIRQTHPTLPVILMSGYSEADVAAQLAQGSTTFLDKPFRFGDLERALAGAFAGSVRE